MAPMHYVQSKLFTALIDRHDFNFQLPTLSQSSWDTIVGNGEERERLEFTGDAYMTAAVGENLYSVFPDGSPFLYTISRNALTANSTFARIMDRLGFGNPRLSTKASGDAFESIIGAKKQESPALLDQWFRTYYLPLLVYTADVCRSLPRKGKPSKSRTVLSSIRLRSQYGSPARRIRSVLSSPASLTRKQSVKSRLLISSPSKRLLSIPTKFPRRTIDLTVDSDSEDVNSKDENEIVQISFQEFSKSQQQLKTTATKSIDVREHARCCY
ncbi:hypothetical protein BT96DRAFT_914134 [Gymnopus androsaceus JB14]|uniref:RNase III domain-containing protein n=1 Tax=Gymnopus androsaceus JB14 TaxID=1447944 RepID=A0A6A4I813_9AGAR|nr:hypothetical protein BT96DRAFT_914134 [Gymnopus androsaceus JB14]